MAVPCTFCGEIEKYAQRGETKDSIMKTKHVMQLIGIGIGGLVLFCAAITAVVAIVPKSLFQPSEARGAQQQSQYAYQSTAPTPSPMQQAKLQEKRLHAVEEIQAMLDMDIDNVNLRHMYDGTHYERIHVNQTGDSIYIWLGITTLKDGADLICRGKGFDQTAFREAVFVSKGGDLHMPLPVQCSNQQ